ncbi:unnamed protein product, partial [marine sediment metagenome]
DINFFLELPNPLLFHTAKINIFVPNQEWCFKDWVNYLPLFDYVWCKTQLIKDIFDKYMDSSKVIYTSWNSIDKFSSKFEKKTNQCLHIAGRSILKGTNSLIETWKPEWPLLIVVYNKKTNNITEKEQHNIEYHRERLDDNALTELMNTSSIHLCPSEAEGFGHYINEARSCKSIVITTNAEPMKNFTNKKYLIDILETIDMKLTFGSRNIFDKTSLCNIMNNINSLNDNEILEDGIQMRLEYLENITIFRKNLQTEINKILNRINNNTIT